MHQQQIEQIETWLDEADGLLITAGAGMGVDSGLPDFRGDEGFWKAYPALAQAGIRFVDAANPKTFHVNPRLAWGFYGHRLQLYRRTTPHAGFGILKQLGAQLPHGYFVYTSNVDGQFQHAGFDANRICECHGSIHLTQCLINCTQQIYSAESLTISVDDLTCQWLGPLPLCRSCGGPLRPNILMFDDWHWNDSRQVRQEARLFDWLRQVERPLVIELGAGSHIKTVRQFSEQYGWRLVRVNPREFEVHPPHLGIDSGALDFCLQLQQLLDSKRLP
ncbi:NAD-dependent deacetylase [Vogesella sp. GCM10023246]|uniref:protein acetyllysine N-acetyltransferase n=1 Tax=Vogesella oryzagri TaxID=3160864 RepID=A0ABV1M7W2_9NEIS